MLKKQIAIAAATAALGGFAGGQATPNYKDVLNPKSPVIYETDERGAAVLYVKMGYPMGEPWVCEVIETRAADGKVIGEPVQKCGLNQAASNR